MLPDEIPADLVYNDLPDEIPADLVEDDTQDYGGWLDAVGAGLENIPSAFARAYKGGTEAVGDLFGGDNFFSREAERTKNALYGWERDTKEDYNLKPGGMGEMGAEAISGSAPYLLSAPFSLPLQMAGVGVMGAADAYGRYRDQGASGGASSLGALGQGAINAASSHPIFNAVSTVGRVVPRMLKGAAAGGSANAVAGLAGQKVSDWTLGEESSLEDYLRSATVGGLTGGLMGGAFSALGGKSPDAGHDPNLTAALDAAPAPVVDPSLAGLPDRNGPYGELGPPTPKTTDSQVEFPDWVAKPLPEVPYTDSPAPSLYADVPTAFPDTQAAPVSRLYTESPPATFPDAIPTLRTPDAAAPVGVDVAPAIADVVPAPSIPKKPIVLAPDPLPAVPKATAEKIAVDQKTEMVSPVQDAKTPATPPVKAVSSAKDVAPDVAAQVRPTTPVKAPPVEEVVQKVVDAGIPIVREKVKPNGDSVIRHGDPAIPGSVTITKSPMGYSVMYKGKRLGRMQSKADAVKFAVKKLEEGLSPPEGGFFTPPEPPQFLVDAATAVKQKLDDVWSSGQKLREFFGGKRDDVADWDSMNLTKDPEGGGYVGQQEAADKWLEGKMGWGLVRKYITFPRTLAERFPAFKPIYEFATEKFSHLIRTSNELGEMAKPYFQLSDDVRKQVNSVVEADRLAHHAGKMIDTSDAALAKHGLSPEAITGYRALRSMFDAGLLKYGQALKDRAYTHLSDPIKKVEFEAKVDEYVRSLQNTHYVPFGRHGDHFIRVLDPQGKTQAFRLYENKAQWAKEHADLVKKGFKVQADKIGKPRHGAYEELPVNFMHDFYYRFVNNMPDGNLKSEMTHAIQDMIKPKGFETHFLKAELTPGYSRDFRRSAADYIIGLSHFSSDSKYSPLMADALAKIPEGQRNVYELADKYIQSLKKADPKFIANAQKFMAAYYLSRPMTAALNLTQIATNTMPEAWQRLGTSGKYKVPGAALKDATFIGAKASKDAAAYWLKRDSLKKTNPELAKALDTAVGDGAISEQTYREMLRLKDAKGPDSVVKWATALFRGSEMYNRTHAFITGFEVGKKLGITGKELQKYAEEFSTRTQHDMTSANKPLIANSMGGLGRLLYTFQGFQGQQLRFLRDGLGLGTWRKGLGHIAASIALGGAMAVPGVKPANKLLETFGGNARGEMKKAKDDEEDPTLQAVEEAVTFGVPHLLGFASLGGSLGTGDWVPELEKNPAMGIVKVVGGVPAALGLEAYKAYDALKNNRPMKAAQAIAPTPVKALLKAYEGATLDKWTTGRGEVLLDDPTLGEIATVGFGGTPPRLAEAYIDNRSKQLLKNKVEDARGNHNEMLGQLLARGDKEGFREYLAAIMEKNREAIAAGDYLSVFRPNKEAIKDAMLARTSKAGADRKWAKTLPKPARAEAIRQGLLGGD